MDEFVKITSKLDIERIVARFSDDNNPARKHLLDGINLIKERINQYKQSTAEMQMIKEQLGNYVPAKMKDPSQVRFWLDDIISKRMGAKREGLLIKWDLNNSEYTWDPITKELKCTK